MDRFPPLMMSTTLFPASRSLIFSAPAVEVLDLMRNNETPKIQVNFRVKVELERGLFAVTHKVPPS